MYNKILIIDDEELFREDLAMLIEEKGYLCKTAASPEIALNILLDFSPDIILSDIVMPGRSGIEFLDEIHRILPEVSVIIMTAYGSLETSIEAFRKGAVDYILKPLVFDDLFIKLERVYNNKKLSNEVKLLRREINKDVESLSFVFHSEQMKAIFENIKKVAPQNSNVLIEGESGTGKEIVAKAIHEFSGKKDEPFIAINCAGFQENLLESELFGHKRGAFTGAHENKTGFFEIAGEGTIFLDEITEMPISLQSKLLRVIEQKEFYRVGETNVIPLKARIITATNKELSKIISDNKFRKDLYYRIAVFEIKIPPLRERPSDILKLSEYFIEKFNDEMKFNYRGLSAKVNQTFLSYSWPGNIRELRNLIERGMILCDGEMLTMDGLPLQFSSDLNISTANSDLKIALQSFEKNYILSTLQEYNWNKEKTSRILNINSSTLYRKMAELGIENTSE